jgi:hypothetical protein
MAASAPAAPVRSKHQSPHRGRTYFTAAVLAGVTGAIVAGAAGSTTSDDHSGGGSSVQPVNHVQSGPRSAGVPVSVFHGGTRP